MGCGSRAGNAAAARQARGKRAAERWPRGQRGNRTGDAAVARGTWQCAGNASACGGRAKICGRNSEKASERAWGAFAFVARLRTGGGQGIEMLVSLPRHVASCHRNVSHETFSIMENNGKGFVRGGRGAWHRVRQDVPGAGTLRLRAVGCACAHGVWLFGREGPFEGGRMGVAHARMRLGCLNGPCAQTYGPLERRGGVLECVGRAGG